MKPFADEFNGFIGRFQEYLGMFYPTLPDVFVDRYAHFFLEFLGKIILGVSKLCCDIFDINVIFCMKLDITDTLLNLS